MSLILSGTDGLSDIDGSAATPAIRGTDANTGIFFGTDIIGFSEGGVEAARINADAQFVAAAGTALLPVITTTGDVNTGIFFPAADTIAFTEGGVEAMRINSSGNVGIGTSSQGYKFVTAQSSGDLITSMQGTVKTWNFRNQADGTFGYYDDSLGSWRYMYDASNNHIWFNGTNTERMRITSGGNVLVNTTSNIAAGAKLFAVGSGVGIAVGYGTGSSEYRHLYMNSGDGTLYFFNDTNYASLNASGAWINASDARLKKNIVDIKYGLSDVLKAQPRSYQMNSLEGDYIGFVAQELQTVIPEVVSGDPEKQLGVDYGSLVAVAFKAIQEQQAIITDLTARITALENK